MKVKINNTVQESNYYLKEKASRPGITWNYKPTG
jgi:hypothetical protein